MEEVRLCHPVREDLIVRVENIMLALVHVRNPGAIGLRLPMCESVLIELLIIESVCGARGRVSGT